MLLSSYANRVTRFFSGREQSIVDLFHQYFGSFVMTGRWRYVDKFWSVRIEKHQKKMRFSIRHVIPRDRELNFRETDFSLAWQIKRMRQFRDIIGKSIGWIIHRVVARQGDVERAHFLYRRRRQHMTETTAQQHAPQILISTS